MLVFCRLFSRQRAWSINKQLDMLQKLPSAPFSAATSLPSLPCSTRTRYQQQTSTALGGLKQLHALDSSQHVIFGYNTAFQPFSSGKRVRHITNSVAAPAPTIKHKWDSETAKKALASLAQEPTEFAKGVEVLDSIVKVYTVFSR